MTTQSPIPYTRQDTASKIAADIASSIQGKVIITTGVSPNGLGAHFVETIAKYKPRLLILAGRSAAKLQATADKISSVPASKGVETRALLLDLASQKQIREAAKVVLAYPEDIDIVVNSAGIMTGPYRTTEEGIEAQFGSNHIGHFLFTNLIIAKVLASPNPRVINVSSDGHRLSPVRFEDWNFQDGKVYDQWKAYGQSKSANIIFSKALEQKLGAQGLRSYSLHPGVIFGTSLAPGVGETDYAALKALDKEMGDPLGEEGAAFEVKNLDEGTATHVVAAFDPRLNAVNGVYLEDGNISDRARPTATRPEYVEKLWELSEQLVGQPFRY
ncbi:WW domain-containing oxidoreductase [Lentithecium fluviatile CBS 122367]|uniref:WW domain-containing oxidoreductase n=1 Tax=Lentithecium fluviatile CBS 122367 TaxID=1168545 RepID=A0A6G1J5F5_9PLEO|nr:WW domain-containing oxidoreductase [Lentithecium fluviatile CBS 122367]